MNDGIRHIRGFLAVARLGSFTRASAELHVSQPALTVQVQQLESDLGVKLLDRNKRKVSLTQAGQDLLAPLENILMEVESLMSSGRDVAKLRRDVVTVASVPSIAATLLPRAIGTFCQTYPTVCVRVRDWVGNLMELVKRGEVDFAVGGYRRNERGIVVYDLYTEPICAFVPAKHPLAGKPTVALNELAQYPVVLPQKQSNIRRILEGAAEQRHLSFRPFHETSHISTTIGLVNAGLGIAILPYCAKDCFLSTDVECVRIVSPALQRRVVIVAKGARSFSPAVRKLMEMLQEFAPRGPRTFQK